MKCVESQTLIEEYFDGELDQQTAIQVLNHIESCLSCSAELEQLAHEGRTYQTYERGVDVSPALWANVYSRITKPDSVKRPGLWERWQVGVSNLLSPRFSVAVSAALVLSAVVGTVVVMRYLDAPRIPQQIASTSEKQPEMKPPGGVQVGGEPSQRREEEDVMKETAEKKPNGPMLKPASRVTSGQLVVRATSTEGRTTSQLVRAAEQNYLSAIRMLARDVAQRPSQLDPETRAKLDGALASIDRTILATRRAVQQNPSDPIAAQYMLTAYAKKVEVLKEMTSY